MIRNVVRFGRNRFMPLTFLPTRRYADQQNLGTLTVTSEVDGVRRITLNDPKKRNALSLQMLKSLKENIKDSPSLRCIVINSSERVFSAGHDLKELTSETGSKYHKEVFDACTEVMLSLQTVPVPVIAQVNGIAAAAGCQLVAGCDIVIASNESLFSTPGASVGLFCSTPGIAVSRSASQKMAAYMLLTGKFISAQEALESGLVSKVVPVDKLIDEVDDTIKSICMKSKSVIALGKQFFYKQLNENIENAYRDGCQVMVDNLSLLDAQSGISAFFAKKQPNWTHTNAKAY